MQGRRWILIYLCSRHAVVRRRICLRSGGLRQGRAWNELRRMSLLKGPESARSPFSSAARNPPLCCSLRKPKLAEFGFESPDLCISRARHISHWLKRVTVAKSAGLQNFLRNPYSLPVTRYTLQPTSSAIPLIGSEGFRSDLDNGGKGTQGIIHGF